MATVSIDLRRARRLALARAGLLNSRWSGLPTRAAGHGKRARRACHDVVDRFGYLQLDTVSIAGVRSHPLVLLSRLEGLDRHLGEELLQPGEPLFEYWGHAACWMPMDLYPIFGFRRRALRDSRWHGRVLNDNENLADEIVDRIRREGPIRSLDMEGDSGGGGWWDFKATKRVANALWSVGRLAIRERRRFQRTYDLPERVIPSEVLSREVGVVAALEGLLLKALDGHGWATRSTLARTWDLRNLRTEMDEAFRHLEEEGSAVPCTLDTGERRISGWIRPEHLELAESLATARPNASRCVLLSPFDPVLWDRPRVDLLFGFHQICEIFKPAPERRYGYFCLPVLAGEKLVSRVDLKAHRRDSRLEVLSTHLESAHPGAAEATAAALERYSRALEMELDHAGNTYSN